MSAGREQSRARLPGRDRLHRARRRSGVLGALRRRQPDDPPDADVVDRPLAPLEAADPLPRPPLPGRHVRRPRQRPLRPPDRGRGLRGHASSSPTPSPSWTRPAPTGRWPRGCRWARASRSGSPSSTRTACIGLCLFGSTIPSTIASRTTPTSAPTPTSTSWSPTTTAGTSTTPTTGGATGRASRPGSPARRCSPSGTRPRQVEDTVGWFLETDPETMITAERGAVPRAAGGLGAPPAGGPRPRVPAPRALSGPGRPRLRRPHHVDRHRAAGRGGARRHVRRDRGRRPLPHRTRARPLEPG